MSHDLVQMCLMRDACKVRRSLGGGDSRQLQTVHGSIRHLDAVYLVRAEQLYRQ